MVTVAVESVGDIETVNGLTEGN